MKNSGRKLLPRVRPERIAYLGGYTGGNPSLNPQVNWVYFMPLALDVELDFQSALHKAIGV